MTLHIRPAQPFDAAFAAPLIAYTIGAIGWALTGTAQDDDAAQVIGLMFGLRGHRLSYTHTLIAEQAGRPVGVAVLYPGELAHALDEPFRVHLRSLNPSALGQPGEVVSEGRPGELYLDTLAVVPQARGQGVGAALLLACAARADAVGLPLALLVEDGNPARRLYERHGFVAAGRDIVAGHTYTRLMRPLPHA